MGNCDSYSDSPTVPQAQALDAMLARRGRKIDHVIALEVNTEELVARLAGRLTCPKCSTTFHPKSNPPKVDGVCDKCGSALVVRPDDAPASVRQRLVEYETKTAPLTAYYDQHGTARHIDGLGGLDEVEGRIHAKLGLK